MNFFSNIIKSIMGGLNPQKPNINQPQVYDQQQMARDREELKRQMIESLKMDRKVGATTTNIDGHRPEDILTSQEIEGIMNPAPEPAPMQVTVNRPPNAQPVAPKPTPYPTISSEGLDLSNSENFAKIAMPLFEKHDYPSGVGMGQYAGETRGRKGTMADRNNFYNLGAVDSNPDLATSFPTPEAGIEAYIKYASGQADTSFYGNGAFGKAKHQQAYNDWKMTRDEDAFLQALKDLGYASRPDYVDFIKSIPEYPKYKRSR